MRADEVFWLSLAAIFVVTTLGAFLRRLAKDRCLALLDGFHATYLAEGRPTTWGDLAVTSQGIALAFDVPLEAGRGLVKASALIYKDELARCIAIARSVHGLAPDEIAARARQLRRSCAPRRPHRLGRGLRNALNTFRDGVSRSLTFVVGRLSQASLSGAVVHNQGTELVELSGQVLGLAANAYEPLLEPLVGQPVVLELALPPPAREAALELGGYLVDYTAEYVAVFNVDHTPEDRFVVEADLQTPAASHEGLTLELRDGGALVSWDGPDVAVLRRMEAGPASAELGVALLPGCSALLPLGGAVAVALAGERTRRLDLVCPRSRARVRFGGALAAAARRGWQGAAPAEYAAPGALAREGDA